MGAPEHPGVQLAGYPAVVGVLRAPRHFEVALDARDRLPDDAQAGVRRPGRGHRRLLKGVLLLAVLGLLALDVDDAHRRPPVAAASSAARCPARTMFW